jgi:hypothetical protein
MRPARAATNLAPTATYTTMCIYQQNGYKDREGYLDYGDDAVDVLISILSASEDFDGLITSLEDMANDF